MLLARVKKTTSIALIAISASSHNILDRGRCNSNAPELVYPTHTPHPTARFSFIRLSRAALPATAPTIPENPAIPMATSIADCSADSQLMFRGPFD
jgi:hypothetical protein